MLPKKKKASTLLPRKKKKQCLVAKENKKQVTAKEKNVSEKSVIPILTGHMWYLTSCHLRANLWPKFHLDLSKVIFRQQIYKQTMPNFKWCNVLETEK